jgi:putative adhesin
MKVARLMTRAGFLGLLAALSAGCAVDAAPIEGGFDRTLAVNGPADLDVRGGSGSVQIETGPVESVHVVAHIRANAWLTGDAGDRVRRIEAAPPIEQAGNTIRIGQVQDEDLYRNVSISYELTVPEATRVRSRVGSGAQTIGHLRGAVDVISGSGRIRIGQIDGDVQAMTGSGSIDVEGAGGELEARAGSGSITAVAHGPVVAETGSGRIELTQTSSAGIDAKTGSGGIAITGARGVVRARAGSGRIRIEGQPLQGWDLHTGSGSITMRVVGETPFNLDAHSSSGRIESSHPVNAVGASERRRLRGTVRGGGAQVLLETGSGGISIQ